MRLSLSQVGLVSGIVWLVVGGWLLSFGLGLAGSALQVALLTPESIDPFLSMVAQLIGGVDRAGVVIIAAALLIGYLKGRFVLIKSVRRVLARAQNIGLPIPLNKLYGKGYLMLIAGMMLLGMSMKWLALPNAVRGFVDIAVGSALINGALLFFRASLEARKAKAVQS